MRRYLHHLHRYGAVLGRRDVLRREPCLLGDSARVQRVCVQGRLRLHDGHLRDLSERSEHELCPTDLRERRVRRQLPFELAVRRLRGRHDVRLPGGRPRWTRWLSLFDTEPLRLGAPLRLHRRRRDVHQ